MILLNKSDLDTVITPEQMKEKAGEIPVISASAKEEKGIRELEETVKGMFLAGSISFNDQVYITNARQKNALISALESMKKVTESIGSGMPEDFYSIDLMDAYDTLGSITGETAGEIWSMKYSANSVWENKDEYDVAVIGAGHAGCEAALAAARLGFRTVVFTVSVDSIALMPLQSEYRRQFKRTSGAGSGRPGRRDGKGHRPDFHSVQDAEPVQRSGRSFPSCPGR